jgi:hypothetical protein
LRELIDAQFAENPTDTGHSRVVDELVRLISGRRPRSFGHPGGVAVDVRSDVFLVEIGRRSVVHGAELVEHERHRLPACAVALPQPTCTDPFLAEENGAAAVELYRDSHHHEEW